MLSLLVPFAQIISSGGALSSMVKIGVGSDPGLVGVSFSLVVDPRSVSPIICTSWLLDSLFQHFLMELDAELIQFLFQLCIV